MAMCKTCNEEEVPSSNHNDYEDDGGIIADLAKIAPSMNEFFCTIGDRLSKKIPDKPDPFLSNEYSINRPS